MDQIRIDPTNVFASAVGEANGIERRALDAWCARRAVDLPRVLDTNPAEARTERIESILDYVASAQGRFRAIVVLAAHEEARLVRAVQRALVSPYAELAAAAALPPLIVLDETDPDVVGEFLDAYVASECLFLVAARDGDASEAAAPFRVVRDVLARDLGEEGHKDHVVFAGLPRAGELREVATAHGYGVFHDAPGTTEDVLSSPVLLAAALVGVDVKGLVSGAAATVEGSGAPTWESNAALGLAGVHAILSEREPARRATACAYGHRLRDLAEWTSPAAPRPAGLEARLGDGDDAWVTLLAVDRADHRLEFSSSSVPTRIEDASLNDVFGREREAIRAQLVRHGRPNLTVHFPSVTAHSVGQYLELVRIARELRRLAR